MLGMRMRGHVWRTGVMVDYFFDGALTAAKVEKGTC